MSLKNIGNVLRLNPNTETNYNKITESLKNLQPEIAKTVLSYKGFSTEIQKTMLKRAGHENIAKNLGAVGDVAKTSSSKLSSFGSTLAGVFTANPLMTGALVVGAIGSIVQAVEQHRQQLIEKTQLSASDFSQSTSALEGYKQEIETLKTSLSAGSLTESEAIDAKSRLLQIQQELSTSYGNQAANIDLVNGSLRSQLTLMDQLGANESGKFLNENKKGIDLAKKEMNKSRNFDLGTFMFDGSEDSKALQEIVEKYDGITLERSVHQSDPYGNDYVDNVKTIVFKGDATQAEETINDFMNDVRLLQTDNNNKFFDNILTSSSASLNKTNDVLAEYEAIYKQDQIATLYNDQEAYNHNGTSNTAKEWLNSYREAVQEYNDALLKNDQTAIDATAQKFESIDTAVKVNFEDSEYQSVFTEVGSALNEAAISANDFNVALDGKGSDTSQKNLKKLTDDLKAKGLSGEDFELGVTTDGADTVFNNIMATAKDIGFVADDSTESIQKVTDALIEAGIVSGQLTDEMGAPIDSITSQLDGFQNSYNTLQAAMSEMSSNGKLSTETIDALKNSTVDYSSCLYQTSMGMQIDTQKARELTEQQQKLNLELLSVNKQTNKTKYDSNYKKMKKLAGNEDDLEAILNNEKNLGDLNLSIPDTLKFLSLQSENSGLQAEIDSWTELESSINNSLNAYQQYKDAQSSANSSDIYNELYSGVDRADDLYNRKWTNQDDFLTTARLLATNDATDEEATAAYEENSAKFKSYYEFDDSGSLKAEGLLTYLDECKAKSEEAGEAFVTMGGNGEYIFDYDSFDEFADQMGHTTELTEIFMAALRDSNIDVDFSKISENLSTACEEIDASSPQAVEQIQGLLSDLQLLADQDEDISAPVQSLSSALQLLAEGDTDVSSLVSQLNEIGKTSGFSIDEETFEVKYTTDTSEVEATDAELEQGGTKTIDAEVNSEGAEAKLDEMTETESKQVNVETVVTNSTTPETPAASGQPQTISYVVADQEPPESKDAMLKYVIAHQDPPAPNTTTVNYRLGFVAQPPTATVKVHYDTSGKPGPFAYVAGLNFAKGTIGPARAQGDWGVKNSGTSLVGELGPEIVVRGGRFFTVGNSGAEFASLRKGDIVFNHRQSEILLNRGFITGRGKIIGGNAFADGTVGDSSGSSSKSSQIFNGIERRLKYFSEKVKAFADKINDFLDIGKTVRLLNKQLKATVKEEKANTKAAKSYEKKMKNLKMVDDKGDSHGSLSNSWKKRIKKGDYSISEIDTSSDKGKALANAVSKYQEYYDAMNDCKTAAQELKNEQLELYEQIVNVPIEKAEKAIDRLTAKLKTLKSASDVYSSGGSAAANYEDLITKQHQKNVNNADIKKNNAESSLNKATKDRNKAGDKLLNQKGLTRSQIKAVNAGKEIKTKGLTGNALKAANAYNKKVTAVSDAKSTKKTATANYNTTKKSLTEAQNIAKQYANKPTYQGQNAILDAQLAETQNIDKENQKSLIKANKNVTTAQQASNKANKARDNSAKSILNNKKYTKHLSAAQEKALSQGKEVSLKGIKDKKTLEAIEAYNAKVAAAKTATDKLTIAQNAQTDAANNAAQSQADLANALTDTALDKLKNIKSYYDSKKDYESALEGKMESDMKLNEAKGLKTSESDYRKQMSYIEAQKKILADEKDKLQKQLDESVKNGTIKVNTEEWYEWQAKIIDVGNEINNCDVKSEELKDTIRNAKYDEMFNKALEKADALRSAIGSIANLIDSEMMFDDDGALTDMGMTALAANVSDLQSYKEDIQTLLKEQQQLAKDLKDPASGLSQSEYDEKLKENQKNIQNAVKDANSAQKQITSMYEKMAKAELDAVKKQIDGYKQLAKKKKEYNDYDKTLKEKEKDINLIRQQIAALSGLTDAESRAKKARLEAELAEKEESLRETVQDHIYQLQIDGLDQLQDDLEKDYEKYVKELSSNLDTITEVVGNATDLIKDGLENVTDSVIALLKQFGVDPKNLGIDSKIGFAKGTRYVPKTGKYLTQEQGAEIIVTADGLITPLNRGDGVIPADMTSRLYDMAMGNIPLPELYLPTPNIPNHISTVTTNNVQPDLHYEININGAGMNNQELADMIEAKIKGSQQQLSNYVQTTIVNGQRKMGNKRRY